MAKYQIGKDIGEILCRLEALEKKVACCCDYGPGEKGELTVRILTDEERELDDREREEREPGDGERKRPGGIWCTYMTMTSCPPLGIRFGDTLCVSPCPPCPDIIALRVVDAQGNTICTMRVRWLGAGHCTDCPPGGHRFIWA